MPGEKSGKVLKGGVKKSSEGCVKDQVSSKRPLGQKNQFQKERLATGKTRGKIKATLEAVEKFNRAIGGSVQGLNKGRSQKQQRERGRERIKTRRVRWGWA